MEQAVEAIFLWSIRDTNSTVIVPRLFSMASWICSDMRLSRSDSVAVPQIKSVLPRSVLINLVALRPDPSTPGDEAGSLAIATMQLHLHPA